MSTRVQPVHSDVGPFIPYGAAIRAVLSSTWAYWLLLLLCAALGMGLSNWPTLLWFGAAVAVCAPPGFVLCAVVYGTPFARHRTALGHVILLGMLLTTVITVCLAKTGLPITFTTFALAALIGTVGGVALKRLFRQPLSVLRESPGRLSSIQASLTLGLLLLLLITAVPLLHVGEPVGGAAAYAPQFHRDFFRNIAIGASLAQHGLPVQNPFYVGGNLYYYWFQLVMPAAVYGVGDSRISLEMLLLLATLLINVSFVFVFVRTLYAFLPRPAVVNVTLILALVCESYQAPFKALLFLQPTYYALDYTWLGSLVLPPVGYFFQALLYLPQHLAALTALLAGLGILLNLKDGVAWRGYLAAAAILSMAAGFSLFIIGFGFLWLGSYVGLSLAVWGYIAVFRPGSGEARSRVRSLLAGLAVVIAVGLLTYASVHWLQMLAGGSSEWAVDINKYQLLSPVHFLIMLGPMFVLGLAGMVIALRAPTGRRRMSMLYWLLAVALVIVVFVYPVRVINGRWEVSQKLGFVLRIGFLAFAGIFVEWVVRQPDRTRRRLLFLTFLVCLSAVPNLLAYELVHIRIGNSPVVVYLDQAEKDAAAWIRHATPKDSIVQSWPDGQRSAGAYSQEEGDRFPLIPAFAERASVVGDVRHAQLYLPYSSAEWAVSPELRKRTADMKSLYTEPDRVGVGALVAQYRIDYVYWGRTEHDCCAENLEWYRQSPQFGLVYDRGDVQVFAVLREPSVHP